MTPAKEKKHFRGITLVEILAVLSILALLALLSLPALNLFRSQSIVKDAADVATVAKYNPASFDIHSLGPDGSDATSDDINNW